MRDKLAIVIRFLFSLYLTVVIFGMIKVLQHKEPEYTVVEDNAVETIISIDNGDEITLLSINRFEDGGGFWVTDYDGKNEPKTRRVE